jgi:hypothetical protein
VVRERAQLKRGDKVGLAPLLDRIHLFDAESGKAL